jgi:hypothetical protein
MTTIRMLVDMQGRRWDGRPWPGYGNPIEVSDEEAAQLIGGGNAEPVEAPELDRGFDVLKVADPDYESGLKLADGSNQGDDEEELRKVQLKPVDESEDSYDFDDDFESVDDDNDVTPQVKRPATVDNKAAWIDYAVSKGASREVAASKTKAQLAADY